MGEALRPPVPREQLLRHILLVERDVEVAGSRVLAWSQLAGHTLGCLRGEARHCRLEWRCALVILEEQEIVGGTALEREGAERLLLFVVSCRWPVELEVLLELGVKRARRNGLEEAARRLVLYFELLALHLPRRVLLLSLQQVVFIFYFIYCSS